MDSFMLQSHPIPLQGSLMSMLRLVSEHSQDKAFTIVVSRMAQDAKRHLGHILFVQVLGPGVTVGKGIALQDWT
jgi:hypothetical protein